MDSTDFDRRAVAHLVVPKYDVAVIGAGVSGLQAAQALRQQAPELKVVVLEASGRIGGRVKSINGIAPWPVEVGPEFLHGGDSSSIKKLVDAMGCKQREYPFPDRYYFGRERRWLPSDSDNPDVERVHEIFGEMAEQDESRPDESMRAYLERKGVNENVMELAQAIYANDFGCSLDALGVRESIHEAQNWSYGDTYFVLDRPLQAAVDFLAQGLEVRKNWPVQQVEYSTEAGVRLTSREANVVLADRAIVTVPITVLRDGDIEFCPPLSESKLRAARSIGMSTALKIVCAFSYRFWPADLFDVVCTHTFVPEVWFTTYPPSPPAIPAPRERNPAPPKLLGAVVAIGFVAGDQAHQIAQLPEKEIFERFLAQLDTMFAAPERHADVSSDASGSGAKDGNGNELKLRVLESCFFEAVGVADVSPDIHPATAAFSGGHIENWADEPFIRGAYSHPSVGGHSARGVLSQPVQGRLFFAGEATHPGVNPCLQAALDTGARAAFQICASQKGVTSRL
ncbi:hypothetical protein KFL_003080050 [Klebsormidium nitens]|uniref:Amine oxidase domain-containing protein n=1 Tax=Klebsormidium nitens TaxID=105231 RepID=A0A1Y1I705_KLENI|nr:hypothetical protein KFL_003080050 [Klebsormidium nitens]|eukprot:GAQ86734.1 hypothetical protein KFL_003080050 [Klebsormidium nitens]